MIFVTSIKQNTTENEQKFIQIRIRRELNYIIHQKDNNENKYYLAK